MKNINYAILRSFIKIILFAILISFSFSCNDSMNEEKALQYVVDVFPNAKIYRQEPFVYLVLDSNNLHIVECMNLNNSNISSMKTLKRLK